jgi:hypothetical protein
MMEYGQADKFFDRELRGEADEQAGKDTNGGKYWQVEPESGSLKHQRSGAELAEVVEKPAGGTDSKQTETAGFLTDAHRAEGQQCAADTVEENRGTAAKHGSQHDAHREDQKDVALARQSVECDDRNEICQAEFRSRGDKGEWDEAFKHEKSQGLCDEQAQVNQAEWFCHSIHWFITSMCWNDVGGWSVGAAFHLDDKLMRQAHNDIAWF